ncbi:MAG: phosphoribosyltransferase family protein [Granulosicoccaceae bacterium]
MSTPQKRYITSQQLLDDSMELGRQILQSGFRPNYIVGVWRGGTPVGIAVQELLDFYGVETDHIAIRTSSYQGMRRAETPVRVHGQSYLTRAMNAEDSLLICDDVFDTGLSVKAILESLQLRSRKNMPHDVRVATAYYKPSKNKTDFTPHYCAHETDEWLVFPHELEGLTMEEIREHKPHLLSVIDALPDMKPAKLGS